MIFEPKIRRKDTCRLDDTVAMMCFLAAFLCIGAAVSDTIARAKTKETTKPVFQKMRVTRKILTKNTASVYLDNNGDDVSDASFWEGFEHGVPESYSNVVENQTAEMQEWKEKFPNAQWFFNEQRQ